MVNFSVQFLGLILSLAVVFTACEAKKVHYVHWNRESPMFRIDNTDHIVDVKENDQVNLICPVSKPGSRYPEKHVVYSVSREEFDSCRITNPKPRIVAVCNRPHRLMYFTITFRSFTPTPGGLEFLPGQDYYFISTSSREDIHRRVGGGCSTNNMKMVFKVKETEKQKRERHQLNLPRLNLLPETSTTERTPERPRDDFVYYYHPRDVIALENAIADTPVMDEAHIERQHRQAPLTADSYSSSSSAVLNVAFLTLCSVIVTLKNLS